MIKGTETFTRIRVEQSSIPCICLTCGIRNDHTHPDGFCQNGHDDWIEYRDVILIEGAETGPLNRACRLTGLNRAAFRKLFLDPSVKQINFK